MPVWKWNIKLTNIAAQWNSLKITNMAACLEMEQQNNQHGCPSASGMGPVVTVCVELAVLTTPSLGQSLTPDCQPCGDLAEQTGYCVQLEAVDATCSCHVTSKYYYLCAYKIVSCQVSRNILPLRIRNCQLSGYFKTCCFYATEIPGGG